MDSQVIFPRHLVVSHGRYVEKNDNQKNLHVPRTIEYIHTIRILNPNICNHQQIIEQLHLYYKEIIMERDAEIQDLKKLISYKEEQISIRNYQLQKLHGRPRDILSELEPNNIYRSRVEPNNQFQVSSIISDKYIPAKRKSFLEMFNSKIIEVDDLQVLKVKKEMKNTEQALNNVTNILRKSRKKYNFFNPHLPESSTQIEGTKFYETSHRKSHHIASDGQSSMIFSSIHASRVNASYNKQRTDQMHENTYESSSKKTYANRQVRVLMQEMTFMKKEYEEQIEKYKALLNCQKQKNCKNILHSMGINISLDEESADIQRIDSIGIKYFDDTQFMQEGSSQLQKSD